MHPDRTISFSHWLAGLLIYLSALIAPLTHAASAQEINIQANATLKRFINEIMGGQAFLNSAKGVLIFPQVLKAGVGVGGEYGEGVLRINNQATEYYNTAAASIGFQLGAQTKSIVLVFMSDKALTDFRNSKGWKAGVDGSVALVEWGVGKDINTVDIRDPIVGFVFNNKGLMYNLTLEGSKFTKIQR